MGQCETENRIERGEDQGPCQDPAAYLVQFKTDDEPEGAEPWTGFLCRECFRQDRDLIESARTMDGDSVNVVTGYPVRRSCREGGYHAWNEIPGHRVQCDDCGAIRYDER